MATQYTKIDAVTEILNDLVCIHNDRIAGYEQALKKVTDLDENLKGAFEQIICKAEQYKQQIAEKITDIDGGHGKRSVTLFGKVYRAWVDLKMTFTGNTRKAMIAYCQYNEDIAQHAYRAALNFQTDMHSDIRLLIERQQEELEQSYNLVKAYREQQHFSQNSRMAYTVGIF